MSKPGERALQAIKQQDKAVAPVFKKPLVPKAKAKDKIILTEEEYLQEMGKIIQRDFFPDLQKLKAQNEYLDALANNDVGKMRQIFSKYNSKLPPNSARIPSPATFETPLPNATPATEAPASVRSTSSVGSNKSTKSIGDKHSLDSFLQSYTSEDNDSFQEIIESADRKLRQKFAVLYQAEASTALQMNECLALPSIEQQFDKREKPKQLDMWSYTNKNYIMYTPEGVELTKEEQLEMAKLKQEINHSSTRLHHNPFNEQDSKQAIVEAAKTQAKHLPEKIGIDGRVVDTSTGTPKIRGFVFVKSPSPCPGVTDSPLFTWGEIEGTPFRLDAGDTPLHPANVGPSFRIVETSKRENLALQLAEKAAEKSREKKAKAIEAARRNIGSPSVRSSFDRLASMSPAARRLASNKLGFLCTPSPLVSPAPSGGIKTPTVAGDAVRRKSSRSITPSPRSGIVRRKTPAISSSSSGGAKQQQQQGPNLTDDLLDIPAGGKRQKAADFF